MTMEVDDEPVYEFSTLKGQLADSPTVTIHLKVAFCDEAADDQARMALQVTAIVDIFGDYVAYEGFVIGNKAADQTLNSRVCNDDDKSAAVRVWLRDARAALVGSSDKPLTAEYEYHLRREDNDRLLTLAWKIKLRPFGLSTLGMVQMTELKPRSTATVSLACTSFITPLIRMLAAERKHQQLSDLAAADREQRQIEDNRQLLDQIQLMADRRQIEDQRLMARFIEVLNAKKRRILNLQQELAELKLEQNVQQPEAIAGKQEKVIVQQRRGRGTCRGQPRSIKKIRLSTTQVLDLEKSPISTSMPVSPTVPVSPILPVNTSDVNVPDDPRYLADTQIDSPNNSPPWLQQPMTVSPSPLLQPSINQHGEHQLPKKKSVLDDLWSGIV